MSEEERTLELWCGWSYQHDYENITNCEPGMKICDEY